MYKQRIQVSENCFYSICNLPLKVGLPGAMGGLVSSQPQLFARPPMLGLPGQQGKDGLTLAP